LHSDFSEISVTRGLSPLPLCVLDNEQLTEINKLLSFKILEVIKMTNNTTKLLDIVALIVDLPEHNLQSGEVGTVVELLADGAAFEVEFSDDDGQTYESIGLRPEQFIVVKRFTKRSNVAQQSPRKAQNIAHVTKN
jgi:hypothetical protein